MMAVGRRRPAPLEGAAGPKNQHVAFAASGLAHGGFEQHLRRPGTAPEKKGLAAHFSLNRGGDDRTVDVRRSRPGLDASPAETSLVAGLKITATRRFGGPTGKPARWGPQAAHIADLA